MLYVYFDFCAQARKRTDIIRGDTSLQYMEITFNWSSKFPHSFKERRPLFLSQRIVI